MSNIAEDKLVHKQVNKCHMNEYLIYLGSNIYLCTALIINIIKSITLSKLKMKPIYIYVYIFNIFKI